MGVVVLYVSRVGSVGGGGGGRSVQEEIMGREGRWGGGGQVYRYQTDGQEYRYGGQVGAEVQGTGHEGGGQGHR